MFTARKPRPLGRGDVTKKQRPPLFTMRADDRLWADLDALQVAETPIRSRTEIVRELIERAAARVRRRGNQREK